MSGSRTDSPRVEISTVSTRMRVSTMGAMAASESPSEGGGVLIRPSVGRCADNSPARGNGSRSRPTQVRGSPPGGTILIRVVAQMLLPAGPPPDLSEHPKLSVGPTADAGPDPVGEGAEGLPAANGPVTLPRPRGPQGGRPGRCPARQSSPSRAVAALRPAAAPSPTAQPPPIASSMRSTHTRTRSAGCRAEAGQTMCRAYVPLQCRRHAETPTLGQGLGTYCARLS